MTPGQVFFDAPLFDVCQLTAHTPFEVVLECVRDVFRTRLTDEDCDSLIAEFVRIHEANWRVFDDVLPALDALAARPLGVITNGSEQQRRKLESAGIADRFAAIVASDAAKTAKPDPRIFHYAAEAIGARPEHCVHVGDDWRRDVEGATAAGFRAIWLVRPGASGLTVGGLVSSGAGVLRIESLKQLPVRGKPIARTVEMVRAIRMAL